VQHRAGLQHQKTVQVLTALEHCLVTALSSRKKKSSALICNFTAVSVVQSRNAPIQDAFIVGLCSSYILQQLLEDNVTELQAAFDKVCLLNSVQSYNLSSVAVSANHSLAGNPSGSDQHTFVNKPEFLATKTQQCFFCGARRHPRGNCPAKNCVCHICGKKQCFGAGTNMQLLQLWSSLLSQSSSGSGAP